MIWILFHFDFFGSSLILNTAEQGSGSASSLTQRLVYQFQINLLNENIESLKLLESPKLAFEGVKTY